MLKQTGRTWFSRFLQHPARKRSGSIFTTLEPARKQLKAEVLVCVL